MVAVKTSCKSTISTFIRVQFYIQQIYLLVFKYIPKMKAQYDDFDENDQFQYIGLGAGRKNKKLSKNQQIYGDFYEAYEQQEPNVSASKQKTNSYGKSQTNSYGKPYKKSYSKSHTKSYGDAYNRFKAGSVIQNYAAECDVHIPEPKKKVKIQEMKQQQQQIEQPQIGQFNLQSFLRDFQQKEELQRIEQQSQEEEYNGPFCLNNKVKKSLKLVKIGQEEDESDIDGAEMNINEMTFQQYRKLVMRNGHKQQSKPQKRLTAQQKQKEKQFLTSYGKGYSMLQKMGFNLTKGLGKDQKGITKPVQAVFKTAFTTKDSQLREEDQKQQQSQQTNQQQVAAQTAIFQFRSKNIKINNFLLDLKNKFQAIGAKMYFYQRQLQQVDRDGEISQSLKLQKSNQLQQHKQEIGKLTEVRDMVKDGFGTEVKDGFGNRVLDKFGDKFKDRFGNYQLDQGHNKQLHIKHAHLALQYKLDLLYTKTQYTRLKSLADTTIFQSFPTVIKRLHTTLNHFYLYKQRQTRKHYRDGIKNFTDYKSKLINTSYKSKIMSLEDEQEVIDLVDETETETVVMLSPEDQVRIQTMVEVVAQNTLSERVIRLFGKCQRIEDFNHFKMLECFRAIKQINQNSQFVKNFITNQIKPLVINYYRTFDYQQQPPITKSSEQQQSSSKSSKQLQPTTKFSKQSSKKSQQNAQPLPYHVLFPLFQIMDPSQLQLNQLLKSLSKKLWDLKTPTLFTILKPILQYCPIPQRQHFLNFYLAPRLLYFLQEFDLTQPHICKQLMTMLKLYKQLLPVDSLKDLLNCTIVPEIVMTYKKYQQEGTGEQQLRLWAERWAKEVGKVVPNHLEEVLINDFNINI